MKNFKISVLSIFALLALASCSSNADDIPTIIAPPAAVNEEEVITTVKLSLIPVGVGTTITLTSRDLDGTGPGVPVITGNTVPFALNKTYDGIISVLNETVTPAVDITGEIANEALGHQFFYQNLGSLPAFTYTPIATAPTNYDANGKPVGTKVRFVTTTTAAAGSLKITLRHEGDKTLPGVATGSITNATGATDFEVTFSALVVQ